MYQWVEHTAELELAIEAASEAEVLADALGALCELLDPGAVSGADLGDDAPRRSIAVAAGDRAALLAAWLEELVFLAESEGFVGCHLVECRLDADELHALVSGRCGEPRPIVKAVTYHRLTFERGAGGYVATVVLDV